MHSHLEKPVTSRYFTIITLVAGILLNDANTVGLNVDKLAEQHSGPITNALNSKMC